MVPLLKLQPSKPGPFCQCRPDEPPSSSLCLAPVPEINLCSQARDGCSNRHRHLRQHSKASAESFQLTRVGRARCLAGYPQSDAAQCLGGCWRMVSRCCRNLCHSHRSINQTNTYATACTSRPKTGSCWARTSRRLHKFVESGAAQIGIIALSIAVSDSMRRSGTYWIIPLEAYPLMDQAGIILKQATRAGHLDAARAFTDALRSPRGRAILERYGFSLP